MTAALWLALAVLPYGSSQFGTAAACLPPHVPALEAMRVAGSGIREIPVAGGAQTFPVTARLYEDAHGARFLVYAFRGAVAIVDDHPDDPTDLAYWLDPGMVTDDSPPVARADPKPTCQWRRRVAPDT